VCTQAQIACQCHSKHSWQSCQQAIRPLQVLIEYEDWPALVRAALERPGDRGQHLEAALCALAAAAAPPAEGVRAGADGAESARHADVAGDDEEAKVAEERREAARRHIGEILAAVAADADLGESVTALSVISTLQARALAIYPSCDSRRLSSSRVSDTLVSAVCNHHNAAAVALVSLHPLKMHWSR
jgi:hypothetical protein